MQLRALTPAWTVLGTLSLVTLAEVLRLPGELLTSGAGAAFFALAQGWRACLTYLWGPVIYLAVSAILASHEFRTRLSSRQQLGTQLLLAGLVSAHAWQRLALEPIFADRWWTALPFLGLVGFLAALTSTDHARWPRTQAALTVIACAAGLALLWLNPRWEAQRYLSLHYCTLVVGTTLLGASALQIVARGWIRIPSIQKNGVGRRWLGPAAGGLAATILFGLSFADNELNDRAQRYLHAHTALGQARLVLRGGQRPGLGRDGKTNELMVDPDAAARFARHSGLPALPASKVLRDFNIMLITIETLRFDATSLSDRKRDLTPNLAAFAERGAFVFRRAYAPSTATLQSIASLMTMHPPSGAELDLMRNWKGALRTSQRTAPEALRSAGWKTFAAIHNHTHVFETRVRNLQQGFEDVELVLEARNAESRRTADTRIVDATLPHLDTMASSDAPVLGWTFLVSPHLPYVKHDPSARSSTRYDRYRQEVTNADKELGRLIDAMEARGLLEDTIVIIAGDHGEEFKDHGDTKHASTVYEEVAHVPLLVWIPGRPGHEVRAPTSLTYLFPWLLSHAEPDTGPRKFADEILATVLGPMLRASEGAVVVELLGEKKRFTALIGPQLKLILDHANEVHQLFDLEEDPKEKRDLVLANDSRAVAMIERMDAYLEVMRTWEQTRFVPDDDPKK